MIFLLLLKVSYFRMGVDLPFKGGYGVRMGAEIVENTFTNFSIIHVKLIHPVDDSLVFEVFDFRACVCVRVGGCVRAHAHM